MKSRPAYPYPLCVTLNDGLDERRHEVDVPLLALATPNHQVRNIKLIVKAVEFPADKAVRHGVQYEHFDRRIHKHPHENISGVSHSMISIKKVVNLCILQLWMHLMCRIYDDVNWMQSALVIMRVRVPQHQPCYK